MPRYIETMTLEGEPGDLHQMTDRLFAQGWEIVPERSFFASNGKKASCVLGYPANAEEKKRAHKRYLAERQRRK